ncbi:3-oxoacyl-ACP synthase III family protein [Desulforamulus ferrireducens]|uniref:3-oxoacyl-ACP synthase n=1 Tax=Desulforamulus ferrireducens TaxID=1833852 RepID=A0A1S6ITI1_9FIRM|nr:3-oxoacyl-[acyl-carrier-protein] synthase III C-terminal domain-containing protein [Desulforamulus ferrireducens]AQS58076.1 hypothetical protein B0537_02580 [Desulforamulus ferrireducens]
MKTSYELADYQLSGSKAVQVATPVGITAIGSYLPPTKLTNDDFKLVNLPEAEKQLFVQKFGMRERRFAKQESLGEMGVKAAQNALDRYGISPLDIDLVLVTHSCKDMHRLTPPIANFIQTSIGASNACSFNIDNGFNGFLPTLFTAASYIGSGFYNTVLVVATEALLANEDCADFASLLIGDGAAAVVVQRVNPGDGLLGFHFMSWECEKAATLRIDRGYSLLSQQYEIKPFMRIEPNSLEVDVPKLEKYLPFTVNMTLDKLNLTARDINLSIFGQQYLELNRTWANNLGINYELVHDTIAEYAAMKTASIPVTIDHAVSCGKLNKGDLLLLADQGANWSFASAVIKWCL